MTFVEKKVLVWTTATTWSWASSSSYHEPNFYANCSYWVFFFFLLKDFYSSIYRYLNSPLRFTLFSFSLQKLGPPYLLVCMYTDWQLHLWRMIIINTLSSFLNLECKYIIESHRSHISCFFSACQNPRQQCMQPRALRPFHTQRLIRNRRIQPSLQAHSLIQVFTLLEKDGHFSLN